MYRYYKYVMFTFLLFSFFIEGQAQARPVSYPGGWTFLQMNDGDSSSLQLHYSPTARYSVGYIGEVYRDKEWQFHGVQTNFLLKRWNEKNAQANFYLKTAEGIAQSDFNDFDNEIEAAGFVSLALDWEDRDYFFSYENKAVYAGDIDQFYKQSVRVGVTPYVGEYGDLHTWLMLQIDHEPEKQNNWTVTPLIRLFKGPYLFEAGVSNQGEALVNTVIRF